MSQVKKCNLNLSSILTSQLSHQPQRPWCSARFNFHLPLSTSPTLTHIAPFGVSPSLDTEGKEIEDFINNNNLCFLNTKTITYIHPATGSKTAIDLSICDPSLMMDLSWSVHDDLCGSDHFPIVLKTNKPASNSTAKRWKLNKADWTTFREMCDQNLREKEFELATNPTELFTSKLIEYCN